MIRQEHLSHIFPESPELWSKLLGSEETKEATEEEIVANVYKQKDLRQFIGRIFDSLNRAEDRKIETWRCQHLRIKISRHPSFAANAPENALEIPPLFERKTAEEFGTFPQDRLLLAHVERRAAQLRDRKLYFARQISESLSQDEKTDPSMPKKTDLRSLGGKDSGLDWNEASICGQRFALGGLPKTMAQVSTLFRIALENHDHIFVSLHEADEHRDDRISNFWENERVSQLDIPGWAVNKIDQKVVSSYPPTARTPKGIRIIESTLLATAKDGSTSQRLSHFHFDGWPDASELPSIEPLFDLLSTIMSVCKSPEDRIFINCIGGIGRTGSTAMGISLMRLLDAAHSSQSLDTIYVDIPEMIYQLRKQRRSAIGQPSHIVHLYELAALYFRKLAQQVHKPK